LQAKIQRETKKNSAELLAGGKSRNSVGGERDVNSGWKELPAFDFVGGRLSGKAILMMASRRFWGLGRDRDGSAGGVEAIFALNDQRNGFFLSGVERLKGSGQRRRCLPFVMDLALFWPV